MIGYKHQNLTVLVLFFVKVSGNNREKSVKIGRNREISGKLRMALSKTIKLKLIVSNFAVTSFNG